MSDNKFRVGDRVVVNESCEMTGPPDFDALVDGAEGAVERVSGSTISVRLDRDSSDILDFDESELDAK